MCRKSLLVVFPIIFFVVSCAPLKVGTKEFPKITASSGNWSSSWEDLWELEGKGGVRIPVPSHSLAPAVFRLVFQSEKEAGRCSVFWGIANLPGASVARLRDGGFRLNIPPCKREEWVATLMIACQGYGSKVEAWIPIRAYLEK